jgi:predicted nucleic acid-binding Zn ribbon protein
MTERRRPGQPQVVGDALRGYLAKSGLGKRIAQAQVIPDWPRLVGPQIAAVATPESVTPDGTLFVRVATSAWMTELQLMAPHILTAVNAGPGSARIRAIRWLLSLSSANGEGQTPGRDG